MSKWIAISDFQLVDDMAAFDECIIFPSKEKASNYAMEYLKKNPDTLTIVLKVTKEVR